MWDTVTTMWDASFPAIFLKFSFSFHFFFFCIFISLNSSFHRNSFSFTIESSSLVHPRFKPVLPCHLHLDYAPCDDS